MKLKTLPLFLFVAAQSAVVFAQTPVAHFNMSLNDGKITESVSSQTYTVTTATSQLPACTVAGLDGDALRFDGYSNMYVQDYPQP